MFKVFGKLGLKRPVLGTMISRNQLIGVAPSAHPQRPDMNLQKKILRGIV